MNKNLKINIINNIYDYILLTFSTEYLSHIFPDENAKIINENG
jgi:hypothetical protein